MSGDQYPVQHGNLLKLSDVMLFNDHLITFSCWRRDTKEIGASSWEFQQYCIATSKGSDKPLHLCRLFLSLLLALLGKWLRLMVTVKGLIRVCICTVFCKKTIYEVCQNWQNILWTTLLIMWLGFVYKNGCHHKPDATATCSKTAPII